MKILPPPEGKLIVTTTRSHSSSTVNDAISAVSPDEVLRVGGAGHKVGKFCRFFLELFFFFFIILV